MGEKSTVHKIFNILNIATLNKSLKDNGLW